jgi:hypothetical protein
MGIVPGDAFGESGLCIEKFRPGSTLCSSHYVSNGGDNRSLPAIDDKLHAGLNFGGHRPGGKGSRHKIPGRFRDAYFTQQALFFSSVMQHSTFHVRRNNKCVTPTSSARFALARSL